MGAEVFRNVQFLFEGVRKFKEIGALKNTFPCVLMMLGIAKR